jgi:DNA adenine methylase
MPTPVIKYFGSKWRDAHRLINLFPEHQSYVEPFGGSAAILLQKAPAPIETYNDLSGDVVNFFLQLRENTLGLIARIELTPYSKEEYFQAFEWHPEPMERARRFYIRSWQGYGSSCFRRSGWRFLYQQQGGEDVVGIFNRTDHLWEAARRLKGVQIEQDDAIAVIDRYGRSPESLIYCDPPYPLGTRKITKGYDYEMSDEQHATLYEALSACKGKVIVSGYDCRLYRRLYKGWHTHSWDSQTNSPTRKAQEVVWCNFDAIAQLPLFRHQEN